MNFEPSAKVRDLSVRVRRFMDDHILPAEAQFARHMATTETPFATPPFSRTSKPRPAPRGSGTFS